MNRRNDISLLPYNTFGIDAKCRSFAEYDSPEELGEILKKWHGKGKMLHIGGGSNLLFLGDYDGLILHSNIKGIETTRDGLLRVGAAVVWDDFVAYTLKNGWYGLENLSLIPGEIGASAVQNIGAYGAEAANFIECVECMNLTSGEQRIFTNAECHYGYRQSIFKAPEEKGKWAVLYVTYRLSRTFVPQLDYGGIRAQLEHKGIALDTLTAEQLRQTIIELRQSKLPDPKVQGNAGSFFVNPVVSRQKYETLVKEYPNMPHYEVSAEEVKIPAGWMIEQCGWKGRSLGNAAVHDKQALVLVNKGGATGQDIVRLCETIQETVHSKFGIQIHPEVNFI